MAVVIETTLGDITVDLFVEQRPQTCLNFIKLCRIKYYNYNLFHMVRSGFIAQTGDPTGEGSGGQSIWGKIFGPDKSFFSGEKMPRIRHTHAGLLSMVCIGDTMVGSQFFFTLAPNLDSLDGVHCVIGAVTEGIDVLRKFNDIICDETYRPYQDVRITHTVILEDPFLDPPGLVVPSRSPSPSAERLACGRIAPDEEIDETKGKTTEEIQEIIEEKEAKARATILEIVGDLPDADVAPPENVLFVCKLNPVTTDDDLEIIFSRFGKIVSCEVIRDRKTGDSLQYAFIEFADKKSCEDAYFKMDNVLIDDRRIHVDFSQSVSKIKWLGKGKGVKHITDNGPKNNNDSEPKSRRSRSRSRDETKSRDRKLSKNKENSSRAHIEKNRYKDRKQRQEHKNRSRSRSKLEQSPSRNKYERRRIRDRTPDDKSHRSRDHHYNSRNNRNENKIRDKHHSDKDKKDHEMRSPPTSHKEKCDREKKMDHSVNGKKKADYLSSSDKKTYENITIDKSHILADKSKHKHRHEKSPGTPPKDKDLKAKIKKESSSVKPKKNNAKSVKKKRKPSFTSSSDTDSSASSSSSETSSSSESDSKKKKRKRKRKQSTSSSSSSSSTTSSSSESSSSSDSSSESSHNKKRKKKKMESKKMSKKSKNK